MEDTQIINTLTYYLLLLAFISHIYMSCCLGQEFEFQVGKQVLFPIIDIFYNNFYLIFFIA